MLTKLTFPRVVDHTILKAESDEQTVAAVVEEAKQLGAASACVNGVWVPLAARILESTPDTAVCAVVGFALGASTPTSKAFEAAEAEWAGATEIDMVAAIGVALSGDDMRFAADIRTVRQALSADTVLKVILETSLFETARVTELAAIAADEGADFVKTSTGFHAAGGATVEAVRALRSGVPNSVGVKASGGVRTAADAKAMLDAGATRLGLSGTNAILAELPEG